MALSRICFLIILCWHTTSGLYFAKTNYKTRETHNDAKQHLFNNLLRRHLKNGLYGSMENVLHSRSSDDCKGLPAAITEAINYNYEEAKDQITRKEFAMQAKMITGIDPFNATQVYDLACRLARVTTLDELYELCRPMLPPSIDKATFKKEYHKDLEGINRIGGTKGLEKSIEMRKYIHVKVNEHTSLDYYQDYRLMDILEMMGKENVLEAVQYLVKKYGSNLIDYLTLYGGSVDITDADVFVESLFNFDSIKDIQGVTGLSLDSVNRVEITIREAIFMDDWEYYYQSIRLFKPLEEAGLANLY